MRANLAGAKILYGSASTPIFIDNAAVPRWQLTTSLAAAYVHALNVPSSPRIRTIPATATESVLLDVIRLIAASPRLSQRTVASSLGMSLGKANYCIRALIEKGFVKAENYRNSSNKLGYVYLLTPSGIVAKAELTSYFLARKVGEYEALRLEIEQLQKESEGAAQRS
jgi:EPS-associated MarR family transcriptional regulator